MNRKKTAFLFLVLIFLVFFYFWKAKPKESPSFSHSVDRTASRILTLGSDETVQKINLNDFEKETDIVVEKTAEKIWRIKHPVDAAAEPLIMDGLVTLLKLSPRSRELSLKDTKPEEIGFDKPKMKICIWTNRGNERCLLIGTETAVVKGAYAGWQDETAYFMVNPNFLSSFDKTVYSIRKKEVFHLGGKEITEIKFQAGEVRRALKKIGKNWILTDPKKAGIPTEKVNSILDLFAGLYVKIFLDGIPKSDPKFGLESNATTLELIFQDGSKQSLIWGAEAFGLDGYYALGPENETPVLISREKIGQISDKFSRLI